MAGISYRSNGSFSVYCINRHILSVCTSHGSVNSAIDFFLKFLLINLRERETWMSCSTYLSLHWLILGCAETEMEPTALANQGDSLTSRATLPGQCELRWPSSVVSTQVLKCKVANFPFTINKKCVGD